MARFENGWVKVHRKLTHPGNDIGANGYRLAIMVTLIAWANREESTIQWNGKPRKIQRGQVIIGVRDFAEHLKFSKDTVWRQIDYLCKRDTIRKEAATEGTLITILNYETYQDNLNDARQDCDKDETQAGHDSGRQPNASRYPIGEEKKRRREEVVPADLVSPKKGKKAKPETIRGAIKEFNGSPILQDALSDVAEKTQRGWIEAYADIDWIKTEILKAVGYYADEGIELKRPGQAFSTWLGRANHRRPAKKTFTPKATRPELCAALEAPGASNCVLCTSGKLIARAKTDFFTTKAFRCACAAGKTLSKDFGPVWNEKQFTEYEVA